MGDFVAKIPAVETGSFIVPIMDELTRWIEAESNDSEGMRER
jgi:hypothetical protein